MPPGPPTPLLAAPHHPCRPAQYGKVEAFVVPREGVLAGRPASDVGKCLIKYAEVSSARAAIEALDNRQFDGLVVQAEFIPEETL